jgi:golgi-specific brefeldin A-resistance guanine nucleotide exchange factor 1
LERPGAIGAIEDVGAAVTHCRFEGTDPETDEVVLTKILNVLRKAVQVEAGALLSDQLVYDMVQTCFKMSIQMHLSVLLRKSAELALMEIVQHVYGIYGTPRKHQIEQAAVGQLTHTSNMHPLPTEVPQSESPSLSRVATIPSQTTTADGTVLTPDDRPSETAFVNPAGVRFDADDDLLPRSAVSLSGLRPFGLPVLVKLFRFFCSIINPNYANNTDTMRFLGLALVNCVLEISSSTVEKTPKLLELVRDDLSKFLLQSLGTTDNVSIMTVSLRVAFNLFISLRHKLKFQMELFFNCPYPFPRRYFRALMVNV